MKTQELQLKAQPVGWSIDPDYIQNSGQLISSICSYLKYLADIFPKFGKLTFLLVMRHTENELPTML